MVGFMETCNVGYCLQRFADFVKCRGRFPGIAIIVCGRVAALAYEKMLKTAFDWKTRKIVAKETKNRRFSCRLPWRSFQTKLSRKKRLP